VGCWPFTLFPVRGSNFVSFSVDIISEVTQLNFLRLDLVFPHECRHNFHGFSKKEKGIIISNGTGE
jgi:hypothetical protein